MMTDKAIELRKIVSETEMWRAQRLYLSAFPEQERRELNEWIRLCVDGGAFHGDMICCDGEQCGILTYWDLKSFVYVEHFALDDSVRGQGIGGQAIDALCEHVGKPVVLEVELPVDEMSRRRISFYQRHGFSLCENKYIQPSYHNDGVEVELKIMYRGIKDINSEFNNIVRTIYKQVYGVTEKMK